MRLAMSFTVEHHVGRLIEVRIGGRLNPGDMPEFYARVRSAVSKPRTQVIICGDLVAAEVLDTTVSNRVVDLLRASNLQVERSAYLINESAIFGLQIERIIREARNDHRRAFRRRGDLFKWLSESLTEDEAVRLHQFLPA